MEAEAFPFGSSEEAVQANGDSSGALHPPELAYGLSYSLSSPLAIFLHQLTSWLMEILGSYGYFIVAAALLFYYLVLPRINAWRETRRIDSMRMMQMDVSMSAIRARQQGAVDNAPKKPVEQRRKTTSTPSAPPPTRQTVGTKGQ